MPVQGHLAPVLALGATEQLVDRQLKFSKMREVVMPTGVWLPRETQGSVW